MVYQGRIDSVHGRFESQKMPKGPQEQRRPADTHAAAIMIARIATAEIQDNAKSGRVKSGHAGAKARAKKLTPAKLSQIAKKAAAARWS